MKEMFHTLLFCLCCLTGVLGDSVSVMEGDSVSLYAGVNETFEGAIITWYFGVERSVIAEISFYGIFTYNYTDDRFRNRLKLDKQTGSLTITNITTQHAGLYEVLISGVEISSKEYSKKKINHSISVYAHLPMPNVTRNFSQNLSSSSSSQQNNCSLVCSVANVGHVTLSWYKGNSLLSSISVSDPSISLSLPLEVEYQEDNTYSCVLNNPITNKTTHLDIADHCWPHAGQKPVPSTIVLISAAGYLQIVATVAMYCICRKCKNIEQEDQTCVEMTIYVEPIIYKGKARVNVKEETNVSYEPDTMRR